MPHPTTAAPDWRELYAALPRMSREALVYALSTLLGGSDKSTEAAVVDAIVKARAEYPGSAK